MQNSVFKLEQQIAQHDETVKQVDEDLKSFSIKAMMDIERFQYQKVVDLKETLAAYCVLQFKLARKVDILNFIFYGIRVLRCFLTITLFFVVTTGSPSLAAHQRLSRKYTVKSLRHFTKQTVTEQ
ncbi:Sorting nexin-4 [Temnothorax longispinosus]|uniref:Sorting nexin-4 n=1 Tax=Temnothorax longispinosus TaxID=300112 RepID=A0A4S2JL19_9HYME|nr:Sorting nexin-4 [Temnothorax longispinosus]